METDQPDVVIPEDLYSRQLYAYGAEAMRAMATSSVLFVGMKGLGVEIAKNVVLSGVKACTFYDDSSVVIQDLGSQFFFHEADVGLKRSEVALPRLAELNPLVQCQTISGALTNDIITNYTVVVCTDVAFKEQLRINEVTHANNVKFISAETHGLFGSLFNDFGFQHEIFDTNGEQPISDLVSMISDDGIVTCIDEKRHGMESGDFVTFSEIQGMEDLNGCEPREIKVIGPYSFSIGDLSHLPPYRSGGMFHQVKRPLQVSFEPLAKQAKQPETLISDFGKFDRPIQIHIGFLALDMFKASKGRYPRPHNKDDLSQFMKFAEKINSELVEPQQELNSEILDCICFQATGDLAPMQSVIGGFAAQEVMKATSGKFTPLKQYFYFDALECLPKDLQLNEDSCAPENSRYDGQLAIWGREVQANITNLKTFVVGSGAIGCEVLKNLALMGVSTGSKGETIITDMDTIEKSNLNRQFLFRSWDVSHLKSEVSSKAAKKINPHFNVIAYQDRVGEQTEDIFDDNFFDSRDVVINALDNVEARQYVDRRCVLYCKPLLESGTLGTKGNTQVVIPHLTESYSSSQDPPEKSIPICTLKNFPSAIEHTIQYARDQFEGYFTSEIGNASQYLLNDQFMEQLEKQPTNHQQEALESVIKNLKESKPTNFNDCISWARFLFQENFHNKIAQLLYNFPSDMLTSSGAMFWSPPKRCPVPIVFDSNNDLHLDFIVSAANLRAFNFSLAGNADRATVKAMVDKIVVPQFVPKTNVKIKADENDTENDAPQADGEKISFLINSLPNKQAMKADAAKIRPADFEKDDDSNFHIDFITAASNLRASNYKIANATRLKTKGIAGKIIPAIATTTSMIAGLSCLELIKIVVGVKDIESFKNGFVNLALPFVAFSEPVAAPSFSYNDKKFNLWNRIDVPGGLTVKQFIDKVEQDHGVEIQIMSQGVSMLYAAFMMGQKRKDRLAATLEQVIVSATKKEIPAHVKSVTIEALVVDKSGEDAEFPFIRYHIKR